MKDPRTVFKAFTAKCRIFLREKGLYVTVACCVGAVALTAALMFAAAGRGGESEVARSDDERLSEATRPTPALTVAPLPTLPAATATPAPTATPIPDFTPAPTVSPSPTPAPARIKLSAPVSGGMLWGFASDSLVYSKTLRQWMTHPGIDLAAKLGEEVRAVAGGEVTAAYTDDALGFTVLVRHENGHETVYANLAESDTVKVGQKVSKGQAIGYVGETAISECALEPHVHFEYRVDGKSVDPAKYVYIPKS